MTIRRIRGGDAICSAVAMAVVAVFFLLVSAIMLPEVALTSVARQGDEEVNCLLTVSWACEGTKRKQKEARARRRIVINKRSLQCDSNAHRKTCVLFSLSCLHIPVSTLL